MTSNKTRIGPRLRQEDGFFVRETLLRVEPTVMYMFVKNGLMTSRPSMI
ncbi:MAG TPA: hypothetical protein VFK47_17160 [Ktedonobacteraceae bacterium]|nr:hypothetical protein [Ktedonobacteraceae bacterium]